MSSSYMSRRDHKAPLGYPSPWPQSSGADVGPGPATRPSGPRLRVRLGGPAAPLRGSGAARGVQAERAGLHARDRPEATFSREALSGPPPSMGPWALLSWHQPLSMDPGASKCKALGEVLGGNGAVISGRHPFPSSSGFQESLWFSRAPFLSPALTQMNCLGCRMVKGRRSEESSQQCGNGDSRKLCGQNLPQKCLMPPQGPSLLCPGATFSPDRI